MIFKNYLKRLAFSPPVGIGFGCHGGGWLLAKRQCCDDAPYVHSNNIKRQNETINIVSRFECGLNFGHEQTKLLEQFFIIRKGTLGGRQVGQNIKQGFEKIAHEDKKTCWDMRSDVIHQYKSQIS